jgi:GR25 family glycosyltransferase involved in LPS biosynthesis
MKIDKVYIIHFDELSNRKNYLDSEIPNRYGFSNYEYIISTRETDKKILDTTNYKYDKTKWTSQLSNSEICNMEIQYSVWEKIANGDSDVALIVEDDIIFKENYNELFPKMEQSLPDDFDMCFLSDCARLTLPQIDGIYFREAGTSRCCVAYILNKQSAKKLLEFKEYFKPVDHHLNFIKDTINLKYYWSTPTVFGQGSESIYESNAGKERLPK